MFITIHNGKVRASWGVPGMTTNPERNIQIDTYSELMTLMESRPGDVMQISSLLDWPHDDPMMTPEVVKLCNRITGNRVPLTREEDESEAGHAYEFNGFHIPDYMMGGLRRWIELGIEPGDFLHAVLTNDLRRAVERADSANMRNLPAYVAYLYNNAPSQCWGSPEKVAAWTGTIPHAAQEPQS